MYKVELISIEKRDAIISQYDKLIIWQRKASINGTCIKLLTNNKAFKEMWEDNFWFMSDDIRPHGRIFALDTRGACKVYYEQLSKTVIILNCDYYGWLKSIALALVADFFEDYLSAQRRFSVHGAALDFGGMGITIIAPSGTGKTTHSLGLLLFEKDARFVSDDWYFVLPSGRYFVANSSEKECYITGELGDIWPGYKPLTEGAGAVFDYKGRTITDISRVTGRRALQQTTIRSAILLKRDYQDKEIAKEISAAEALEFVKTHDFCNPHQLVRTERKREIRTNFFERYFAKLDLYLVNTILTPEETLNRIREMIKKQRQR
ncbi:hypothetical protein ACFLVM_03260 [Chloroflexota bacterium]